MTTTDRSPWPEGGGDVVFLLDAANGVEETLLLTWIDDNLPTPGPTADAVTVDAITVDLESVRPDQPDLPGFLTRSESAVTVAPLRIVWSSGGIERTGPRLRDLVFGDPRNPRPWMARIVLFRHPERARRLVAQPAMLDELRVRYAADKGGDAADPAVDGVSDDQNIDESFADYVLRVAGIALDVAERRLDGRRYKVPRSVAAGIQNSPAYKRATAALAGSSGRPKRELIDESAEYLREMVATPSTFFIDWTGKVTRWIVSLGYGEIVTDARNLESAKAQVRDHPSALLWTHKSHLDGMAVLSVLYDNDFPSPHQMGGINMAFRGLAGVSRRAGVIFIRRTFADNPLYKLTLQQYLGYLMDKRFPFSWAFEGTRSRTGKLMPPRYGLLKYVVEAAHVTQARDLHIIPVAINYDLIGEAGDYVRQEAGQRKPPENFSWFMAYLRRLRAPSGHLYLDFAEPVVLPGVIESADQADLERISFEVARRVNSMVPVTLPALMFTTLLGAAPRALTYTELDAQMRTLLDLLRARDVRMASNFDDADISKLAELAEIIFERGIVDRHTAGPDTVFSIRSDKQAVACYYRNTIVHYFLDKAMTELALLLVADAESDARVEAFWDQLRTVRGMLKFEFFLTPSERFVADVEHSLAAHDPGWETRLSGSPTEARRFVGSMTPLVAHATLKQFIEAYWVVADRFARLGHDETLDETTCVADAIGAGEQAFLQQRITSRASIGKQMFKNAYAMLGDRGLIEPGTEDVAVRRRTLAGDLHQAILALSELQHMATAESLAAASSPLDPAKS